MNWTRKRTNCVQKNSTLVISRWNTNWNPERKKLPPTRKHGYYQARIYVLLTLIFAYIFPCCGIAKNEKKSRICRRLFGVYTRIKYSLQKIYQTERYITRRAIFYFFLFYFYTISLLQARNSRPKIRKIRRKTNKMLTQQREKRRPKKKSKSQVVNSFCWNICHFWAQSTNSPRIADGDFRFNFISHDVRMREF